LRRNHPILEFKRRRRSGRARSCRSLFKRKELGADSPTEERLNSFSWFQPHSKTIGVHHGAERI